MAMIDMSKIEAVEDWLIDQALDSASVPDMFGELCERLNRSGVPIDRATIGWSILHPLIEAEMAYWINGAGVLHQAYAHAEEENEDWLNSPMRAVLVNRDHMLRRRLDRPNADHDYPLCAELAEDGYTDYLVIATRFEVPAIVEEGQNTGILVSWATRAENGFPEEALTAIDYIQKRLALAARASLEAQVTKTIAQTYLGGIAGRKVLTGQIRHGDGQRISAVIFYADMRNSTAIAEALGPERYIAWLNTYFAATAGPVLAHGGEILDFIGDAVLAVFPIGDGGLENAVKKAVAASDEARRRIAAVDGGNPDGQALKAGIALSVGDVMFGNIGVPDRLSFSVIGQTVHAAARIEELTKAVGVDLLMTEDVAEFVRDRASPVGSFRLSGFSAEQPLFTVSPLAASGPTER